MTKPSKRDVPPLRRPAPVSVPQAPGTLARRGGYVQDADFTKPAPTEPRPAAQDTPANQDLMQRAEAFKVELPLMLTEPTIRVREFFLREVFAPEFAVDAGLRDADEVIALAFGEKPSSSPYVVRLRAMASTAVMCRAVFSLSDLLQLDDRAAALFLQSQLAQYAPEQAHPDLLPRLKAALDKLISNIPEGERKPVPTQQRRQKDRNGDPSD